MIQIINFLAPNCMEAEYIGEILDILSNRLKDDLSLVATSFFGGENYQVISELPKTKYDKIVFLTSDEWNQAPPYLDDPSIRYIFKTCVPTMLHPKVKPLPLGCFRGYSANGNTKIINREYDFSFNGQVNSPEREVMKQYLDLYKSQTNKTNFLRYTDSFAKGTIEDYSEIMDKTKVVLNPSGGSQVTVDSSRYFEGMRAGCVVVSSPRPAVWFYNGAPHITIYDWKEVSYILESITQDRGHLMKLSRSSKEWWNDVCSPQAVSNYIEKVIQ